MTMAARIFLDMTILIWAESQDMSDYWMYFGICSLSLFGAGFGSFLRSEISLVSTKKANSKLHKSMLESVLNAPINLYFDITPIG